MPKAKFEFLTAAENVNGRVGGGGIAITQAGARGHVRSGKGVIVPAASASSAPEIFKDCLKFVEVRNVENSSSAGDWTWAVRVNSKWRVLSQHNCWPAAGFEYRLDTSKFSSFEALCSFAVGGCA